MKSITNMPVKVPLLLSAIIILLSATVANNRHSTPAQNTIVTLKFKTQPGKSDMAISELKMLFEKVKSEPHFVSIKLHVDPNDKTNILLYEEWEDADYYQNAHMKTPHLEAFMAASQTFLAGPPEISFWTMEGEFKN